MAFKNRNLHSQAWIQNLILLLNLAASHSLEFYNFRISLHLSTNRSSLEDQPVNLEKHEIEAKDPPLPE